MALALLSIPSGQIRRLPCPEFPLPNARSILQGRKYCLRVDDGLGEYLSQIGLARPFEAYSEWKERVEDAADEGRQ